MATQESTLGRKVSSAIGILFTLLGILVLLGIGYAFWPKIKAAYYAAPITTQVQPTQAPVHDDTSELRAQLAALQAQLNAAQRVPPAIVQTVPEGEAPQLVSVPAAPPAAPDAPPAEAAPPPPRLIIVLHENDNHGAPIVTGSGACQVAAKGARRCGGK